MNLKPRNFAIVRFENDDIIYAEIRGTIPEILKYYAIGNSFNLGSVTDNIQKVKSVTIRKFELKQSKL